MKDFSHVDALKNYEKKNEKGMIRTNAYFRMTFATNAALALGNFNPARNYYYYQNVLEFLEIPDLRTRIKAELKEEFISIINSIYPQEKINNEIAHYENILEKIKTTNDGREYVRKYCKKEILKLSAKSMYVIQPLMQLHTFFVMNTDCRDQAPPREWILTARQGKTDFINDPRSQALINQRRRENIGENIEPNTGIDSNE